MSRICKKCLIGQDAEQYLALIARNRDAISPRDRTTDEEYDRRIEICENCVYLTGATCRACGCYAELRAIRKSARCPYKKW